MTDTLNEPSVKIHLWQDQGLGVAPFKVIDMIAVPSPHSIDPNTIGSAQVYQDACNTAFKRASELGVSGMMCQCQSCFQCLQLNVVIQDANGKRFIVGEDCAAKTGDTKIISVVQNLERERQKVIRAAKNEAARQARAAKREAELNQQRERNGGLTDSEVKWAEEKMAAELKAEKCTADNAWVIESLRKVQYHSEFVLNMIDSLKAAPLSQLSPKCLAIIADIVTRVESGATRGKKYDAAYETFCIRAREQGANV